MPFAPLAIVGMASLELNGLWSVSCGRRGSRSSPYTAAV